MLKNARLEGGGGSHGAGAGAGTAAGAGAGAQAGAAGAAGAAAGAGRELKLSASGGVNLSEHLNHQVSVSGRFMGAGMTGTPEAGASGASQDARRGGSPSHDRTLMVSSVKMISATCPADR